MDPDLIRSLDPDPDSEFGSEVLSALLRPRDKKIAIFDQTNIKFFFAVIFFQFLVIKTLDPDWFRIRIGIQPKMLDPDYPKHW